MQAHLYILLIMKKGYYKQVNKKISTCNEIKRMWGCLLSMNRSPSRRHAQGSMQLCIRRNPNMAAHPIFSNTLYGHAHGTHAQSLDRSRAQRACSWLAL